MSLSVTSPMPVWMRFTLISLVAELGQGLGQGLDGALHVGLEHHLEFLDRAILDLLVELFQGHPADACQGSLPLLLLAHHGDLLGLALIFQHLELVSGLGHAVEPLDFHRQSRGHLVHLVAPVVEQGPHPAVLRAADKVIALASGCLPAPAPCPPGPGLCPAAIR